MLKVAIDCGHGMKTAGKRVPATLDPAQTREWWLNNRIGVYLENLLKQNGIAFLRVDDPTGNTDRPLKNRYLSANEWGADIYICIHHNAGGGRGVVVYRGKDLDKAVQSIFYTAVVACNGNVGNRSNPKPYAGFSVAKNTNMPCAYLENGFMDNASDWAQIKTDEYARNTAEGLYRGICVYFGMEKGNTSQPVEPAKPAQPSKPALNVKTLVKVEYIGEDGLNIRRVPDWDAKPCQVVHRGEVFTVVEKVQAKNGDTPMYKLKSGLYITASEKYVKVYQKEE